MMCYALGHMRRAPSAAYRRVMAGMGRVSTTETLGDPLNRLLATRGRHGCGGQGCPMAPVRQGDWCEHSKDRGLATASRCR